MLEKSIDLRAYQIQVKHELIHNILPLHIEIGIDHQNGGFYGLITNQRSIQTDAPKGLVHHTRLLWTYAQTYRILGDPIYLETATRAYQYLIKSFWDQDQGGFYWMLDHRGKPIDTRKLTYGQAFAIYGLSEYARLTKQDKPLSRAIELFSQLENQMLDQDQRGYFDAADRNWQIYTGDSVDQVPAAKTMNTHLHLLEAYTNLLRVWNDDGLRQSLGELIQIMLDYVIDHKTGHFKLHFDAGWQSLSEHISYGHDIEGSWLLVEAAEVLGDAALLATVKPIALKMAQATLEKAVDADGGIFYEGNPQGVTDSEKVWWPQAEAMVGFLNAYQLSHAPHYLNASYRVWEFVQTQISDHQYGEWLWSAPDGSIPPNQEKVSPWKAPYHNGRACMEIMQRVDQLLGRAD